MGGEVIIITSDPDSRVHDPNEIQRSPQPEPRCQVMQTTIKFADHASSADVLSAVRLVLETAETIKRGFKQDLPGK